MGMSNKELIVLEREIRSREALAEAMKGKGAKEFVKEREALERAFGGKDKLEKADKILAEAEDFYAKRVAEAEAEAEALLRDAREKLAAERAEIDGKLGVLAEKTADLARNRELVLNQGKELADLAHSLEARKAAITDREIAVGNAETALSAREMDVSSRERKVDDLDKWLSMRP